MISGLPFFPEPDCGTPFHDFVVAPGAVGVADSLPRRPLNGLEVIPSCPEAPQPGHDGELERLVPWTMDTSMDSNEKGAGHEISQPLEFPCAASMAGPVILP